MQRCQKCDHDGKRVDVVSEIARVDYYRCPKCGEVWTAQKDQRGSAAPEPILTDSENSVA
jgi:uncharacterized Zn finger protein